MSRILTTLGAVTDSINDSLNDATGGEPQPTVFDTVQTLLNAVFGVVGIIAVVMIIMGGVQYTMSQGDPAKTKKAKDTIMYGVIGLVVALLAMAIVTFVLGNVFGVAEAEA